MNEYGVVIVGAGHAGANAAIALRQQKFQGTIALVGDEPQLPYERPPLSKGYLLGDKTFEQIRLRPPGFWDEKAIELRLGQRVAGVDPLAHELTLEDGRHLRYGQLIWAAGGSPRRLSIPGHQLHGIHGMRTAHDTDLIRGELAQVERVAIVGGGYIGLESAAALRKAGKHVTVLESLDRVLARVAGEQLSRFYEAEHRTQGVEVRLGVQVSAFEGHGGRVTAVRLGDGTAVPAELVIVGIGIVPNVGPLLAAGAAGSMGVDVDEYCRTSLHDAYAIGDCAVHANVYAEGRRIRLESVQNAMDQGAIAAKAIMGNPVPYEALPWFWSEQYDLRLQTVGLSTGYDDTVLRGDPATRSFSVVYRKAGRVIALDCVNAPRDYVQGRNLVSRRVTADAAALGDASVPLADLLPKA